MYTWEPFGELQKQQIQALPHEAAVALVQMLDALMFDPWEYGRPTGEAVDKDKPLRTLPFGQGSLGIVTFQIYDPDLIVYIAKVLWLG